MLFKSRILIINQRDCDLLFKADNIIGRFLVNSENCREAFKCFMGEQNLKEITETHGAMSFYIGRVPYCLKSVLVNLE